MYSITIIGTKHKESGKCTSEQLLEILENIKPEIIFDELPHTCTELYGDDAYFQKKYANRLLTEHKPLEETLEIKCLKKYRQIHYTEVVPVDIDTRAFLSKYRNEFNFMFSVFFENEFYLSLDKENDKLIAEKAFCYLNSDEFLEYIDKKRALEKTIIETEKQKSKLTDIYTIFQNEIYDKRENAMLQHIYNYSSENKYNQAVFLIGAEHRSSILKKINVMNRNCRFSIDWNVYNKLQCGENC